MRLLKSLLLVAPLALGLAACGSREDGESAADYAAQLGQGQTQAQPAQAAAATPAPGPKAAAAGDKEIRYTKEYFGIGQNGVESGLQFYSNGTYRLNENGKTIEGTFDWLPDGKRLRLNGVGFRPIVVIAGDGALYRVTNELVPIDDLTPDRMYSSEPPPKPGE